MNHGSQGIQQKGRLFEIGEKERIITPEHGKGERGKVGKNQSWKHRSTCQNCGTIFAGRPNAANRFCRNQCQHEFSVNRWLACSKCLAAIGVGGRTAAKLLHVNSSNITTKWKELGIVSVKHGSKSTVQVARAMITAKAMEQQAEAERPRRLYEEAAMDDIRSHGKGFDWSCIWRNEKSRRYQSDKWHSMTICQKREIAKSRDKIKKRETRRRWGRNNKEKAKAINKRWRDGNPDLAKAIARASAKRQRQKPENRPKLNLRSRFKELMRTVKRGGATSFSSTIGCTTAQLAAHLQSKFKKGMTWANYGTHWHVDHVLPCASFDHNDPKQVAQCWHWTNLRPLEAKKNMDKSDTITEPQMQLLLCASH